MRQLNADLSPNPIQLKKSYRKIYSYSGTGDSRPGTGAMYIIRKDFEKQDLNALPTGTYWWLNEEGKVEKFEKE